MYVCGQMYGVQNRQKTMHLDTRRTHKALRLDLSEPYKTYSNTNWKQGKIL